ncbi:hypothetical protein CC86DRAFT_64403 [Ophiobolus disseminans]|uniref:Uncharacterized protein n=1 Tax=Ophiobolus disseminans TaxID=1469910 RepID=A0A6A6ZRG6_9PLEO|nr:hypothetical protein CC86DRAFT_64403 [Ophiobolus disseminans]
MKFLYVILPLLSAAVLAQDLVEDKCQCPQVKCPADNEAALCKCLNGRETLCKERCPKYKPTYVPCPASSPTPTPKPIYTPVPLPSPISVSKPEKCECLQINCLQVWPGSCHCANSAKQRCFEDCGGKKPDLMDCGDESVVARAPEPEVLPRAPAVAVKCTCDDVFCVQMWPESCHCANAAEQACATKCGRKAALKECPPQPSLTLTTKAKPKTKTPKPTPTPTLLPLNPHPICGGGRGNYHSCDEGYVCITDPYTPGCGPACDALGICVKDKMCGGFAGFKCEEKGTLCHDDPRDECDPKLGGADCGGLCVAPHRRIDGQED